jgi:hypothetical protein
MAIGRRQLDDELRQVLRQPMAIGRIVTEQHLGDAGDPGAGLRGRPAAGAGDEQMDLAADLRRGAHGVERRRLDRLVIVFGQKQDGHETILEYLRGNSSAQGSHARDSGHPGQGSRRGHGSPLSRGRRARCKRAGRQVPHRADLIRSPSPRCAASRPAPPRSSP